MGAVGLGLLLSNSALFGQHAVTSKFDDTKATTLTGRVTSVDWRNPQVHVFMNVTTNRQTLNWAVELPGPTLLEMDGWNKETLRAGDQITVKGPRARDNSRQVWGDDVRFTNTGNLVFPPKAKAPAAPLSARPTPRWPDGHPALGATPGSADGFWTDPSETALIEDGVDVKMDQFGLLANLADAAKVAPMQPWALALYRYRQERQLRDDPMYINCKPPGGARQYQTRLGFQLLEDNARKRVFVLLGSGNRNFRIIYLDGRAQVGQQNGDDDNPLYYGRSAGRWEGNTLVVNTTGFNEDFWFTNGGLPHTSQLTMTERFTRTDFETLRYEVEVDDLGAYTRKWSASWTLKWNGGAELPSHFCQNNRP
jgi:hypothetical protein